MKQYINTLVLCFCTTLSLAQVVQRKNNETAEQFAERLKPANATLTHKVIETKWNGKPVIISLYDQTYKLPVKKDPDQQTYHKIDGTVFIELSKNNYKKTTFGTIDTDGGDPHIEAVFFANADKDKTTELIVIASWQQRHYEVNGTLYGTMVFDNQPAKPLAEWTFLKNISSQLNGGCDCTRHDGTTEKAKFKTAVAIKNELTRLGYKQ